MDERLTAVPQGRRPAAPLSRRVLALVIFAHLLVSGVSAAATPAPVAPDRVQAMALGRQALAAFLRSDFAAATTLYHAAGRLAPSVGHFAFGAARAEQEAGDFRAAADDFALALALTPADHPLHARADAALQSLQLKMLVAAPRPPVAVPAEPPAAVTPTSVVVVLPVQAARLPDATPPPAELPTPVAREKRADSADWRTPAGWTALALGAAAGAVAVALAVSAHTGQGALDGHLLADGRYDLAQISMNDAVNTQRAINTRWGWSGGLGGACIAGLVAGGWWLLRSPDRSVSYASTNPVAAAF